MYNIHKRERKLNLNKKETSLLEKIKKAFEGSDDIKIERLCMANNGIHADYVYVNNMVDAQIIDEAILRPISKIIASVKEEEELKQYILEGNTYHLSVCEKTNLDEIVDDILVGNFALLLKNSAFVFDVKKYEKRGVSEASNEVSVKGAKNAFIEVAMTNVAMVRRRIKNPKLKCKTISVGNVSKNNIVIMYIENLADMQVLQQITKMIEQMDIIALSSPEMFEENVQNSKIRNIS